MAFAHRLLVLGATGPTGRQVVRQALEREHSVTAVSRHADRLPLRHPRLLISKTDLAADPGQLTPLLRDHDGVISVLGRGASLRAHGLMAKVTPALLVAMGAARVERLLFLSAYGVGGTAPQAPLAFRLMFRVMLRDIYADKAIAEQCVRQSTLAWTILAPVVLSNGPATGTYRMGEHLAIAGLSRIPRADVADALLRCLDDSTTVHKRFVLAP